MPHSKAQSPDGLETLAPMLKILEETNLRPINAETRGEPAYCHNIEAKPSDNP